MHFSLTRNPTPHPRPRPRYQKPKGFRASALDVRAPNDQAARLAKTELSKIESKPEDKDDEGKIGEGKSSGGRRRAFSFEGHASEDSVRKSSTTFESLVRKGVISGSALEGEEEK